MRWTDKGFILTGRDLDIAAPDENPRWPPARAPQMLETSLPGVFCSDPAGVAGNTPVRA